MVARYEGALMKAVQGHYGINNHFSQKKRFSSQNTLTKKFFQVNANMYFNHMTNRLWWDVDAMGDTAGYIGVFVREPAKQWKTGGRKENHLRSAFLQQLVQERRSGINLRKCTFHFFSLKNSPNVFRKCSFKANVQPYTICIPVERAMAFVNKPSAFSFL